MDYYSAIYSIRGIGVVFKWPKRPIFWFSTIQCIEMKHLFAKLFGRWADILTFNSEWPCCKRENLHIHSPNYLHWTCLSADGQTAGESPFTSFWSHYITSYEKMLLQWHPQNWPKQWGSLNLFFALWSTISEKLLFHFSETLKAFGSHVFQRN